MLAPGSALSAARLSSHQEMSLRRTGEGFAASPVASQCSVSLSVIGAVLRRAFLLVFVCPAFQPYISRRVQATRQSDYCRACVCISQVAAMFEAVLSSAILYPIDRKVVLKPAEGLHTLQGGKPMCLPFSREAACVRRGYSSADDSRRPTGITNDQPGEVESGPVRATPTWSWHSSNKLAIVLGC